MKTEMSKAGRKIKNPEIGHVEKDRNLSVRAYQGDTALIREIPGWQEMMRRCIKYVIKHGEAPEI